MLALKIHCIITLQMSTVRTRGTAPMTVMDDRVRNSPRRHTLDRRCTRTTVLVLENDGGIFRGATSFLYMGSTNVIIRASYLASNTDHSSL